MLKLTDSVQCQSCRRMVRLTDADVELSRDGKMLLHKCGGRMPYQCYAGEDLQALLVRLDWRRTHKVIV